MVTGRKIGGYEILEELGRGAMGIVFKARQLSMDRIVAIKFLPKKLAQDDRIVARFLREARAAGQLAHPNIVSVHELGISEGLHFIAMEFVDGNSIQKRIKERGPFSEKETLEIAVQIAEALKLAHSKGILHRDIKPDNFLIDSMGRVRLADLGLALIQSNPDGGLTQDGTTLGTPHFMAPEQCSGTNVDARSDLYSLGASMFVMASGRTPYEGQTAASVMVKVLTEPAQSLKKLRPELSSGFIALVDKFMQKEPSKRFQDAAAAGEAIQQCKSGLYKAVAAVKPLAPVAKPNAPIKALSGKPPASPGVGASNAQPGTRSVKPQGSKLAPLMMGAAAAIPVVVLGVFLLASQPKAQPSVAVHPTVTITPTIKPDSVEQHPAVIGLKAIADSKPNDPDSDRHPALRKQLRELLDELRNDKIKPAAAQRRLKDFVKDINKNDPNGNIYAQLRPQIFGTQREIDIRVRGIAEEWKKLDAQVNLDLKDSHIADALAKLSLFQAANDGLEDAAKASDRIDALCSGLLANANKMAGSGNVKDAIALLQSITAKLPEKQDTAFKAALARYEEHVKLEHELADCYEHAYRRARYYDPVSKTCFQFSEGARLCVESASKARSEINHKDMLDMAELFKAADKIFMGLRLQLGVKPVEMASLGKFNNVTVTQWNDKGLIYVPSLIKDMPQPLNWDLPAAPDIVLQLAKELKRSELEKPAGEWDVGVLAFALGIQAEAGKYIREAVSRDDSPYKAQAAVALKLIKPPEQAVAKVEKTEKVEPPPAVPSSSPSIEDDAKQLFKELQDAKSAGNKDKIKTIRADFETKFAATDFLKLHKKDIDDLAAGVVAPADPAKAPEPVKAPDKPKVDTTPPEEKKAREILKAAGWTEIIGTWVWDEANNAIRVDGFGEISNPAAECDVTVRFRMLETTAKMRVLARVEKTFGPDRFALFGGKTAPGFGADVTSERAFVYMDVESKKGRSKEPVPYGEVKLESKSFHVVDLTMHARNMIVYVDGKENKTAGDARTTGDMRIIVNGPMLFVPVPKITPLNVK